MASLVSLVLVVIVVDEVVVKRALDVGVLDVWAVHVRRKGRGEQGALRVLVVHYFVGAGTRRRCTACQCRLAACTARAPSTPHARLAGSPRRAGASESTAARRDPRSPLHAQACPRPTRGGSQAESPAAASPRSRPPPCSCPRGPLQSRAYFSCVCLSASRCCASRARSAGLRSRTRACCAFASSRTCSCSCSRARTCSCSRS
jgi:hypothetical protein